MQESWLHLSVQIAAADLDALANFLVEQGAPGVVMKRRGLEAYFRRSAGDAALKQSVERYLGAMKKLHTRGAKAKLKWRVLGAANWHDSWRRFIKARRVGKEFWVTPPWLTPPKFRQRQVITIEPGLAFGTGTHATTRGCMEFLEQVADSLRGRPFTVLDVGTGAGILAIVAVKLGAQAVYAIDNDPLALEVARDNFAANAAAGRVQLSGANLSGIRKIFSVVVANVTAETIIELAAALDKKVGAKGFLILSGILQPKANAVVHCFQKNFRVVRQKRGREWATLLLQRK
ncbi:MAG: 50S ribosomal protein L11 methyltransferase [Deltaproteobacteria bacterium]|nr:50S ribosomal protein L11 methyltransferase [Deltaproteobacteria bacterium]